jgi:hypothetical protein
MYLYIHIIRDIIYLLYFMRGCSFKVFLFIITIINNMFCIYIVHLIIIIYFFQPYITDIKYSITMEFYIFYSTIRRDIPKKICRA